MCRFGFFLLAFLPALLFAAEPDKHDDFVPGAGKRKLERFEPRRREKPAEPPNGCMPLSSRACELLDDYEIFKHPELILELTGKDYVAVRDRLLWEAHPDLDPGDDIRMKVVIESIRFRRLHPANQAVMTYTEQLRRKHYPAGPRPFSYWLNQVDCDLRFNAKLGIFCYYPAFDGPEVAYLIAEAMIFKIFGDIDYRPFTQRLCRFMGAIDDPRTRVRIYAAILQRHNASVIRDLTFSIFKEDPELVYTEILSTAEHRVAYVIVDQLVRVSTISSQVPPEWDREQTIRNRCDRVKETIQRHFAFLQPTLTSAVKKKDVRYAAIVAERLWEYLPLLVDYEEAFGISVVDDVVEKLCSLQNSAGDEHLLQLVFRIVADRATHHPDPDRIFAPDVP